MAKKFDVYGLPWGGKIGKDVTDCKTSEEVIKKAGLDFMVDKCELVAKMPFNIHGDNTVNETMGDLLMMVIFIVHVLTLMVHIVLIRIFLLVLLNLSIKLFKI